VVSPARIAAARHDGDGKTARLRQGLTHGGSRHQNARQRITGHYQTLPLSIKPANLIDEMSGGINMPLIT